MGWLSRRSVAVVALVASIGVPAAALPAIAGSGTTGAAGAGSTTAAASTAGVTTPKGFTDSIVMKGLNFPSAMAFAKDGRIFVAERAGVIKVFHGLSDKTATVVADLRTQVYNADDRGLLSLALDPAFPTKPYLYISYAYDGEVGGPAPKWGKAGQDWETCPIAIKDVIGCRISGRISRLTLRGDKMASEKVLIAGWCYQFDSHSMGDLAFGADGSLFASSGEGSNYMHVDYGQFRNTCGDPGSPAWTDQPYPNGQGGALRAQSMRRPLNEPTTLDGTVIRINPSTGAAMPSNPNYSQKDTGRKRVVAYGMRNPFRITVRPGTNEVWVGDVGWEGYEEINRVSAQFTRVPNFGWPCFEGFGKQQSWADNDLDMCRPLYQNGGVTNPVLSYSHKTEIVAGDKCVNQGESAITGVAFYNGTKYPAAYRGSLFFTDIERGCIWRLPRGTNGLPTSKPVLFRTATPNPLSLRAGLDGDLFYFDHINGTMHRIRYTG